LTQIDERGRIGKPGILEPRAPLPESPMLRRIIRWILTHRRLSICSFLIFPVVLFNMVAYNHAYAMTHFSHTGTRTEGPGSLSLWGKLRTLITGVNLPRPTNDRTPAALELSFDTHTFLLPEGCNLEAWHIPHAEPKGLVIMFHGYGGSKSTMLPQAEAFHGFGYSTFLVDFRGSGGSSGDITTVGVREADDVTAAVEYARTAELPGPIILYGASMGSAAILRAIEVNGVRPNAIVIECPFDRLLSTVGNRFTAMGLPAFPLAETLVFWGGTQHGFDGFAHNPVDYAASVTCPVLLMHGDNDRWVTRVQAESIFQKLAGEKEFVVFSGVGHQSYLEAKPEEWKEHVSRFLTTKLDR
jgi:uncharacterized protein